MVESLIAWPCLLHCICILHPLLFIRSISAGSGLARMFMHASVFFALVLVLYVAPCIIQSSG